MVRYRPRNPAETSLWEAAKAPGEDGRRARRRLTRRWSDRSVADFNARLARLGPGDVCLDLGANMGDVTETLAATGATVHAFEPDPYAFEALTRRHGGRSNVHLHQVAVGGQDGTAHLRRSRRFAEDAVKYSKSSTVVFQGGRYKEDTIPVPMFSLRFVLAEVGRVALVKMDVEGAEFEILPDVFARPEAYDIDAIFAETHERDDAERIAVIDGMRRAAEKLARPAINLFWP